MDEKTFLFDFVSVLEGYKTALKVVHWKSRNMPEHELCDKVLGVVDGYQDSIAEMSQMLVGERVGLADMHPDLSSMDFENLSALLDSLLDDALDFHRLILGHGTEFCGISSEDETFIAQLERFHYQSDICLGL